MASDIDLECDDKGNPIAVPAPVDMPSASLLLPCLRCSLGCSPQQFSYAANDDKVQQQDTNVNNKIVTLAPAMDARAALKKAESSINANKIKNLSNKCKEHVSIADVVVKLIDQGQG